MSRGPLSRLTTRCAVFALFPLQVARRAAELPDAVIVSTTNPFLLPAASVLARPLHRQPVIALMYDVYPDSLEAAGLAPRPLVVLLERLNRWLFQRVNGVVFIGSSMGDAALARYGVPPHWTVIPTGADAEEFTPTSEPIDPDLLAWCQGAVIASYVGNLGQSHDHETLAEVLRRFSLTRPAGLRFVVAAFGPGLTALQNGLLDSTGAEIRTDDLVRFFPPLENGDWQWLLARSDIALVTLRSSARVSSLPSKVFSAMAAGSAIVAVAPPESDLARLVTGSQCGECVFPGDVDSLEEALLRLRFDAKLREFYSRNGRAAIRQQFSLAHAASCWITFIDEVSG